MPKPTLILASASIGRKGLLTKLGIPFEIIPSTINEDNITDHNPYKLLQKRARAKAENVASQLKKNVIPAKAGIYLNGFRVKPGMTKKRDSYLVIAADSEAILDGKTYGKAHDKKDAKKIVKALMGKTHEFVTATCVISLKLLKSPKILRETRRWEEISRTAVTLRSMTETEIDQYVSRYDFTRFAAGYALTETPWDLVTKIDGSFTNVVGLPFEVLLPILDQVQLLT